MIFCQALESRWAEQVREVTRQAEEEQEATHDKVFELQRYLCLIIIIGDNHNVCVILT